MRAVPQQQEFTATEWTTNNPVLRAGEIGIETDTGKAKRGNGVTAWTLLAYNMGDTLVGDYAGNSGPTHVGPGATVFVRDKGRKNLAITDAVGHTSELQTSFYSNKIARASAIPGSASPTVEGMSPADTGTAAAVSPTTANLFSSLVRYRRSTAATAGAGAGQRSAFAWSLSTTPNMGGFHFVCRVGLAAVTATNRGFVGMAGTTSALSATVETSTNVNIIGFGFDSTHTTWRFMCNDASGTATMVDLGANFRAQVAATDFYEFRLYAPSGGGQVVYWNAVRLNDGAVAKGSAVADLPALGTQLAAQINHSNGTTAAVASIDIQTLYIESDN